MAYQPVGDTLALISLAHNLYTVCRSLREVPKEVQELLNELDSIRRLLVHLKESPRRDRSPATKKAIEGCTAYLNGDFWKFCKKYENLSSAGEASRRQIILRFKYVAERRKIKTCQERLQVLMHRVFWADQIDPPLPIPLDQSESAETGNTIQPFPLLRASAYTTANNPTEQVRDRLVARRCTQTGRRATFASSADSGIYHIGDCWPKSDITEVSPSIGSDANDPADIDRTNSVSTDMGADLSLESIASSRLDVPISAEDQAYLARDTYLPMCSEIEQHFLDQFPDDEADLNMEYWLFVALWWLIKAQSMRSNGDNAQETASARLSALASAYQCSLDAAKSSFLFTNAVMPYVRVNTEMASDTWVFIQDLSRALKEESRRDEDDLCFWDHQRFSHEACSFKERLLQPVEQTSLKPNAINDTGPTRRWLRVTSSDAGHNDEILLFRGFVNAEIGRRGHAIMSDAFPYMLILAARSRGRLAVYLVNQSQTVQLCKELTQEEINASVNPGELDRDTFDFRLQTANIRYHSVGQREQFWSVPRKHVDCTADYQPRTGEFPLFQGEITTIHASSSINDPGRVTEFQEFCTPKQPFSVILYETLPEEPKDYWQIIRRLVVRTNARQSNSSANQSDPSASRPIPWARSWWLPPANISLQHLMSNKVELRYSDFRHLKHKSCDARDFYSFVYRADQRDARITLTFNSSGDVKEFSNWILNPYTAPFANPNIARCPDYTENLQDKPWPIQESLNPQVELSPVQVLSLINYEKGEQSLYNAILHCKQDLGHRIVTDLSFAYRFLDFDIDTVYHRVMLGHLWSPEYVSNMTNMPTHPRKKGVECDPTHLKTQLVSLTRHFDFANFIEIQQFMLNLTGYRMLFYSIGTSVRLQKGRYSTTEKKDVSVILWTRNIPECETSSTYTKAKQSNAERKLSLTIRDKDGPGDPWITASIERSVDCQICSDRSWVKLQMMKYETGIEIDTEVMLARNQNGPRICKSIQIQFSDQETVREFHETIRCVVDHGKSPRRYTR